MNGNECCRRGTCQHENKCIVLPDVLCPWGCSDFCFKASQCKLHVLLQHHLRFVTLNMTNKNDYAELHAMETSRIDFLRAEDDYDTILLNRDWTVKPTVILD